MIMILANDDYARIIRQLKEEREKVLYYLSKNEVKMDKKLKTTRTVPVWHWETVTLPKTKNTYLLYYYALNWREVQDGSCFKGAPLLLNDANGHRIAIMYRRMLWSWEEESRKVECLQVYSGHFFSRYRERMGLPDSLSTNEVIATYFGRNEGYFAQLDYDNIVLEKNRHKGNSAWGVDDGVILSEEVKCGDFWVFKHNTFLSRKELKCDQADATPSQYAMRMSALNSEIKRRG